MALSVASTRLGRSNFRARYTKVARMKYSVMWENLRATPCQKLIPDGERPGKMNFRIGTMNRDVSLDDIISVENTYIAISQMMMGVQYSTISFFTDLTVAAVYDRRQSLLSTSRAVIDRPYSLDSSGRPIG